MFLSTLTANCDLYLSLQSLLRLILSFQRSVLQPFLSIETYIV